MNIKQKLKSKLNNLPPEAAGCVATMLITIGLLVVLYWALFGAEGVAVLSIFLIGVSVFMFVLNWIHKAFVRGVKRLQQWASEE